MQSYLYRTSTLPGNLNTSVVVVEDGVVSQLLELAHQINFYNYAQQISVQELLKENWPESDTVLIEEQGNFHVLLRNAAATDPQKSRAYQAMKINIFNATSVGQSLPFIKEGLDGNKLFQQNTSRPQK